MSIDFEELDYQETELGGLSLRRRGILSLGGMEVYEIQLGDAFLMSSLFTEVEVALADLGFGRIGQRRDWTSSSADWVWVTRRAQHCGIRR